MTILSISEMIKGFKFSDLVNELKALYLKDSLPWCIMSSMGKDSTMVTSLVWDMLTDLLPEQRTKKVYIVTGNTLVETPIMNLYVRKTMDQIQKAALEQGLPIEVHLAEPEMKNRFFFQVIGKGNPPPTENSRFRWCTAKVKVDPTDIIVQNIISTHFNIMDIYDVVMLLGVREEESVNRKRSIQKFSIDETKFARHAIHERVLVYHSIKYLSSDDVWAYLLHKKRLGWGVDPHDLYQLYKDSTGECQLTMSEGNQSKSCGTSRFGCWTCLYSGIEDKMLINQIDNGDDSLRPLNKWKRTLYQVRNDIRYRLPIRKFLKRRLDKDRSFLSQPSLDLDVPVQAPDNWSYEVGSLTLNARKKLLESLLHAEKVSGHSLITKEEIEAIISAWEEEGFHPDVQPKPFDYDGGLVFHKTGEINTKETTNTNSLYYFDLELEEDSIFSLYDRVNRQHEGISFMVSEQYRYYRFIVCHKEIIEEESARRYLMLWLEEECSFLNT
ncbi:hypothetical protein [Paenibacillus periandrae]|uniref:hypothetical protein n=1 Tax=Paenibacillus periandrae TaxID=1761741 RepID=UPI001F097561|nr:hypothetical protein [Paenibacillus periandrae]